MATTRKATTKRKSTKKATARTSSRSINSVEKRWKEDGEIGALDAMIKKYAKMIDLTDSSRDLKPLCSGMIEAIERKNALEAAKGEKTAAQAPVFKILKAANGE